MVLAIMWHLRSEWMRIGKSFSVFQVAWLDLQVSVILLFSV
jgi:hypothetical protein